MIITLDGPVASGKTTVGTLLAKKLGFDYLYSGSLYRAAAYVLIEYGKYTVDTLPAISVESLKEIFELISIEYCFMHSGESRILVNNIEIQEKMLMIPIIDKASSMLALNDELRNILTNTQRKLVVDRNIVADGRDAGVVTFPEATYKFFLTASLGVRIQRYIKRQQKMGNICSEKEAEQIISERDNRDSRWFVHAKGKDTIFIDTTEMNLEMVINTIMKQIVQEI